MSTPTTEPGRARAATAVVSGEEIGAIETIRRGVRHSPELAHGIRGTLLLAVLSTAGQVVVPVAVQQTLDRGINAPGGTDVRFTVVMALLAAVAVIATGVASYLMTYRLFRAAETGLSSLRVKAFRHVHDLPLGTQDTERRGSLVSRVTSDIDQVSQFIVFGGVLLVVSVGQVLVATVVMAISKTSAPASANPTIASTWAAIDSRACLVKPSGSAAARWCCWSATGWTPASPPCWPSTWPAPRRRSR